MLRSFRVPLAALVLAQGCTPELPEVRRPETVIVGLEHAAASQALDSIYWYTGFRPETVGVANGILHLAMPAHSVGHELTSSRSGCESPAIPFGVVQRVAREAWRNAGQRAGADTVIVTVGKLEIEGRNWQGRVACGSGPAMMRIGPAQLREEG